MTIRIHIQIGQKETGAEMIDKALSADRTETAVELSEDRLREIQKTAEDILDQYKLLPGFDLARFLTREESFVLGLKEMDRNTTGVLLINQEEFIRGTTTHKLILINQRLQEQPDFQQRSRFIAAHEYGHYKLHATGMSYYPHRDTSNVNAPQEQEAEYFARCLLMPEKSIRELMKLSAVADGSTEDKAAMIARFFNVTQKKASQRMADLVRS